MSTPTLFYVTVTDHNSEFYINSSFNLKVNNVAINRVDFEAPFSAL